MGRIRGLLLETSERGRGVLLTPDGEFVEVRLPDQAGRDVAGSEVWGYREPWVVVGMRRALAGWPRAATATALAFGAAGALFALVYVRGLPLGSGQEGVQAGSASGTAEAVATEAREPVTKARRSTGTVHFSWSLDASQVSAGLDPVRWDGIRVRRDPASGDFVEYGEHLRRALASQSGSGGYASPGGEVTGLAGYEAPSTGSSAPAAPPQEDAARTPAAAGQGRAGPGRQTTPQVPGPEASSPARGPAGISQASPPAASRALRLPVPDLHLGDDF